jgi:hypothetical protein
LNCDAHGDDGIAAVRLSNMEGRDWSVCLEVRRTVTTVTNDDDDDRATRAGQHH